MNDKLIVVSMVAVIAALTISLAIVAGKLYYVSHATCLTPGCVHAASLILKSMNREVEPCDDFYEFACGEFEASTTIPDDRFQVNHFTVVKDKIWEQLLRLSIEGPSSHNELRPFKLAKTLYKSCVNTSAIEEAGLGTFRNVLSKLGGWPVLEGDSSKGETFSWAEGIQKCRKLGYSSNYLISLSVGQDPYNRTKRVIQLDQAVFGLSIDQLIQGMDNEEVNDYFNYMVDVAVKLGADKRRAVRELTESLKFEVELARIPWYEENNSNESLIRDNPMSISVLNKQYPSVNWESHFNNILPPTVRVNADDIVNVLVPSYIGDLEKLVRNTPNRTLANYVVWRVVADSIKYLTEDLRTIEMGYQRSGKEGRKARWEECLGIVSKSLPMSVGALYVRDHFKRDLKEKADEIMTDIRMQFVEIMKEAEWMDETTRSSAIEKVAATTMHIAYPDEYRDDKKLEEYHSSLEFGPNNFFANILNLTIFGNKISLELLKKQVNSSDWLSLDWLEPVTDVGASYSPGVNSIQVPAGILQGGFFNNDRPRYMNYAAIGSIMGHEITHGFDNEGSSYDKEGDWVDWWDPETKKKYFKNAQCIIDQYGNYTFESVDLKLNGTKTQGENIADNGGIKQAYLAYKKWVKRNGPEPKLPGLEYTPGQMFWVSAASVWCDKIRPEALKRSIEMGVHSPNRFRVIGPFSNRPEFSADFNCPLGSAMNPEHKCSVW